MKQEVFMVLSYGEFEDLVKKNFPAQKDFDFVEKADCSNYSDRAYMSMGVGKCNQDEIEAFEKWSNGEKVKYFGIHSIIEGMIRKQIFQPGNYLIRVSW